MQVVARRANLGGSMGTKQPIPIKGWQKRQILPFPFITSLPNVWGISSLIGFTWFGLQFSWPINPLFFPTTFAKSSFLKGSLLIGTFFPFSENSGFTSFFGNFLNSLEWVLHNFCLWWNIGFSKLALIEFGKVWDTLGAIVIHSQFWGFFKFPSLAHLGCSQISFSKNFGSRKPGFGLPGGGKHFGGSGNFSIFGDCGV